MRNRLSLAISVNFHGKNCTIKTILNPQKKGNEESGVVPSLRNFKRLFIFLFEQTIQLVISGVIDSGICRALKLTARQP